MIAELNILNPSGSSEHNIIYHRTQNQRISDKLERNSEILKEKQKKKKIKRSTRKLQTGKVYTK